MTTPPDVPALRSAIQLIQAQAREQEERLAVELAAVRPEHRQAARNLAHYLALRQHDLRDLQGALAALGLSSLGRSERCVMATLNAVDRALACLAGAGPDDRPRPPAPVDFDAADELLKQRASALLGPPPAARTARIMLTLPTAMGAGEIEALLSEGAEVVRLNCAKGTVADWGRTIEHVRVAARRRGRDCRILCDLAGPNPRTVSLGAEGEGDGAGEVIGRARVGDELCLWQCGAPLPKHPGLVVGCTMPEILGDLAPGDRVFYDDGKLSGVVREVTSDGARIDIRMARKERVKVRSGKGLNFPDSRLRVPSLTKKDLSDLAFVARYADMVGLSFVRNVEHVELLQRELARLGASELGIVLKIETTQAFESLPRLLLTAMQSPCVGIMVARGDMAIELGFERLAEAQEEVLWLGEAAYFPVIWATQVLEGLTKTGVPSRAEVTDAAMAGRAECVMLNQGDYQLEALRFLRNVLERMEQHQQKKRSMLRLLRISRLTAPPTPADAPLG